MAVPILKDIRHVTITSAQDFLSKLSSFATSCGWTTELQTSKAWSSIGGGKYGWVAGNKDFLECKSTGHGSQKLCFRFYMDAGDGTRRLLYYQGIKPDNWIYKDTVSTIPHLQDTYNTTWTYMSIPQGAFSNGCWFFGNKRILIAILGFAASHIATFAVGIPELNKELQDETQISCVFNGCQSGTSSTYYWDNFLNNLTNWNSFLTYVATNLSITSLWWKGSARYIGYSAGGFLCTNICYNKDVVTGVFDYSDKLLRYNAYSGKRTAIQPTAFFRDPSTLFWYVGGAFQFAWIHFSGLSMGQKIKFGSDTYIVFPSLTMSNLYGMAFRVSA